MTAGDFIFLSVMLQVSQKLKFLTGDETSAMMEAHLQAGLVVGEPFVDRYDSIIVSYRPLLSSCWMFL